MKTPTIKDRILKLAAAGDIDRAALVEEFGEAYVAASSPHLGALLLSLQRSGEIKKKAPGVFVKTSAAADDGDDEQKTLF